MRRLFGVYVVVTCALVTFLSANATTAHSSREVTGNALATARLLRPMLKSLRRSENSRRAAVRTTTPIRRTRRIQSSEPIHKRTMPVERGNTGFEATHSCSRIQRAARHLREFVLSRSSALNDGVVDWLGPRHDTEAP